MRTTRVHINACEMLAQTMEGNVTAGSGSATWTDGRSYPVLVEARTPSALRELSSGARKSIEDDLASAGAVLLRGFTLRSPLELREFAASFGAPLRSYEFGSTPRKKIAAQVYSSTEYPSHQSIPLHNEQSYASQWPSRLWFMCQKPAEQGGETPLADSRLIFAAVPSDVREAFTRRELLYVRNYGPHLDLPWQTVFGSDEPLEVERFCREHGIEWEWKPNGELRTRQRLPAVRKHPSSGAWVWFNQAHLFHVSSLPEAARASLLASVGEADLPRNVYFGDGGVIEDAALDAVRTAYRTHTTSFAWQAGDVLMLDNLLIAHGRNPYRGDRRIVVAMA